MILKKLFDSLKIRDVIFFRESDAESFSDNHFNIIPKFSKNSIWVDSTDFQTKFKIKQ